MIDWSNGHLAPPAADVACSVLSIGYRGTRSSDAAASTRIVVAPAAAERYLDTVPRASSGGALADLPL